MKRTLLVVQIKISWMTKLDFHWNTLYSFRDPVTHKDLPVIRRKKSIEVCFAANDSGCVLKEDIQGYLNISL